MTLRAGLLTVVVGAVAVGCGGNPAAAAPSAAPAPMTAPASAPTATASATSPSPAPAASAPRADSGDQPRPEDFIGRTTPPSEDASTAAPAVAVTDAARAKALDRYARQLEQFFRQRWQIPTSVSAAEAQRLCVTFQVNVSGALVIWHVRTEPTKKSGNALVDDSARAMLEKLMQDRTHLPDPPPEVAELFRGRTIMVSLLANPKGDASSCK
jgi:hypothetical protein